VLPVSDLIGLSITGVRWPLDARDVALGSTLTLSNEASGGEVSVSLARGMGVVLVYPPFQQG
jgi:thiamine pyrophosphokinase